MRRRRARRTARRPRARIHRSMQCRSRVRNGSRDIVCTRSPRRGGGNVHRRSLARWQGCSRRTRSTRGTRSATPCAKRDSSRAGSGRYHFAVACSSREDDTRRFDGTQRGSTRGGRAIFFATADTSPAPSCTQMDWSSIFARFSALSLAIAASAACRMSPEVRSPVAPVEFVPPALPHSAAPRARCAAVGAPSQRAMTQASPLAERK